MSSVFSVYFEMIVLKYIYILKQKENDRNSEWMSATTDVVFLFPYPPPPPSPRPQRKAVDVDQHSDDAPSQ